MSHPDWCDREFCTAYAGDLDRPYLRSRPTEITTEDGDTTVYVRVDADNNGRYIEIVELDLPLTGPFWKCKPRFGRETLRGVGRIAGRTLRCADSRGSNRRQPQPGGRDAQRHGQPALWLGRAARNCERSLQTLDDLTYARM